jgi:hypothetical protein
LEAAVQKTLLEQFLKRGWDAHALDTLEIDGVTIRSAVHAAKEAALNGQAPQPGKLFYHNMRVKYSAMVQQPAMTIDCKDDPQDPRLDDALGGIVGAQVNYAPMERLLQEGYPPQNQRCFRAMMAGMLEVPFSTDKGASLLANAMRYIVELKLDEKFPALVAPLTSHFDRGLEKLFVVHKASGLSPSVWMMQHQQYLKLVVDVPALARCIEEKTSWTAREKDLRLVCKSACGSRIFGSKLAQVASSMVAFEAKRLVKKITEEKLIDKGLLSALQASLEQLCKDRCYDLYKEYEREQRTEVEYRGYKCAAVVTSLFQECWLQVWCLIKGRATDLGQLPSLWCERDLCSVADDLACGIEDSLLHDCKVARKAAAELSPSSDAASIKAVLGARQRLLVSMDRYWQVESCFWQSVLGAGGEEKLKEHAEAALPMQGPRCVHEGLLKMRQLQSSRLCEFVGQSGRTNLDSVVRVFEALSNGRAPQWPEPCGEFLAKVKSCVSNYYTYARQVPAKGDEPERVEELRGKHAIHAHYQACVEKQKTGPLSLEDLSALRIYGWMLDHAARSRADEWLSITLTAVPKGCAEDGGKASIKKKQQVEADLRAAKEARIKEMYA